MKYQNITPTHPVVSYEYNSVKCFAQYYRLSVELKFSCNISTDNFTKHLCRLVKQNVSTYHTFCVTTLFLTGLRNK